MGSKPFRAVPAHQQYAGKSKEGNELVHSQSDGFVLSKQKLPPFQNQKRPPRRLHSVGADDHQESYQNLVNRLAHNNQVHPSLPFVHSPPTVLEPIRPHTTNGDIRARSTSGGPINPPYQPQLFEVANYSSESKFRVENSDGEEEYISSSQQFYNEKTSKDKKNKASSPSSGSRSQPSSRAASPTRATSPTRSNQSQPPSRTTSPPPAVSRQVPPSRTTSPPLGSLVSVNPSNPSNTRNAASPIGRDNSLIFHPPSRTTSPPILGNGAGVRDSNLISAVSPLPSSSRPSTADGRPSSAEGRRSPPTASNGVGVRDSNLIAATPSRPSSSGGRPSTADGRPSSADGRPGTAGSRPPTAGNGAPILSLPLNVRGRTFVTPITINVGSGNGNVSENGSGNGTANATGNGNGAANANATLNGNGDGIGNTSSRGGENNGSTSPVFHPRRRRSLSNAEDRRRESSSPNISVNGSEAPLPEINRSESLRNSYGVNPHLYLFLKAQEMGFDRERIREVMGAFHPTSLNDLLRRLINHGTAQISPQAPPVPSSPITHYSYSEDDSGDLVELDTINDDEISEDRPVFPPLPKAPIAAPPTPGAIGIDGACVICLDARAECAVIPCGHLCACLKCGKRLRECPICRSHMNGILKIFRV